MYRIAFGIGIGEDRNGDPLADIKARTSHALRVVADAFGGVVATRGQGAWLEPASGRLITEDSLILMADIIDVDPTGGPREQSVRIQADKVADTLRQIFYQTAVRVTILPLVATWDRFKTSNLTHLTSIPPNKQKITKPENIIVVPEPLGPIGPSIDETD